MTLVQKLAWLAGVLLCLTTLTTAQDVPGLTSAGLEDYKIGQKAPSRSQFPGLTHKRVVTTESEEGETYTITSLKLFLNGVYLGKARVGDGDVVEEIAIVSPLARHEAGYAVGTPWEEAARSFPMGKIHYTYVSDSLWAESESVGRVQLHFDKADYKGKKELRWEFQEIDESDLAPGTKIKKIRIY